MIAIVDTNWFHYFFQTLALYLSHLYDYEKLFSSRPVSSPINLLGEKAKVCGFLIYM